jgi:hypothetical protein
MNYPKVPLMPCIGPGILVNFWKNDSNGTINMIVGAFTKQKPLKLLTINPQYI